MTISKRRKAAAMIALAIMVIVTWLVVLARNAAYNHFLAGVPPDGLCTPYPTPACTPNPHGPRIVFSSNRACAHWSRTVLGKTALGATLYDVYVMNADGTCPTQLTRAADAVRPRWSPDGALISFETFQPDVLYVMSADGSNVRRLADSGECSPRAVWSPDGSMIAFLSGNDYNKCTLHIISTDGKQERAVVDTPLQGGDTFGWSPDGKQFAFSTWALEAGQRNEIHLVNTNGSGLTNLTKHQASDNFVAWTPDGRRILFTSDRDVATISRQSDRPSLYIMDTDGMNVQRLVDDVHLSEYRYDQGVWVPSADSKIIVKSKDEWHVLDIDCVLAHSTKPGDLPEECYTWLPHPSGIMVYSNWPPGGKQFSYSVQEIPETPHEIYVVNFDGTGLRNLTNCPADDIDPDWSP